MWSRADLKIIILLSTTLCLSGCFTAKPMPKKAPTPAAKPKRYKIEQDIGPHHTERLPDFSKIPNAVPRHEPKSRIGNPKTYTVFNKTYCVMQSSKGYKERGTASWYGKKFHGFHTSNGEVYDMYGMSAAHKTLPLPTYAKVTNLSNGKHVIVKINDRGPFHDDRLIDLSYAAASKLGILATGTAKVEIQALDPSEKVLPQLYFQIGSYDLEKNAKKLATRIDSLTKGKKHNIAVKHTKTKTGKKYHVFVGPLNDEKTMADLTNTLIRNKLPKPQKIKR